MDRPANREELVIRIGSLDGFRDLVFERGGNPDRILEELDLDPALWATPDHMIPVVKYRMALNLAATQTDTPHFGLLLSQRQSFDKFGAIGYLVKHSPNLGTAIRHMTTFLARHDSSTSSTLTVEGGTASWSYRVPHLIEASERHQCELGAGIGVKFIRSSIDQRWSPDAVLFTHSAPKDQRMLDRVLRCAIYFEADATAIEFPASDLDLPLTQADPRLHDILLDFLREWREGTAQDTVSLVKVAIAERMGDAPITLVDIANQLGLTRSELQRHLRARGKTFQKLLEAARLERAQKLLTDTKQPLTQISVALGYAQLAVFTRAFKRSTGVAPSVWRSRRNETMQ